MIAEAEPEIGADFGHCTWHESEGKREVVLQCEGNPNVYWDLQTAGTFNWVVPTWNRVGDVNHTGDKVRIGKETITGDKYRIGNEHITGYIELTPEDGSPGIKLYAAGGALMCILPDGTEMQVSPYPESVLTSYTT